MAITNNSGSALANYQVPIYLNTAQLISNSKMKADCSDIRIVDANGNLVPLWIATAPAVDACNHTATKLWVKVASLPATSTALYIYYGNSGATAISNGTGVFPIFADFTSGSSLPNTWTKTDIGATGKAIVGNGVLSMSNTNGEDVWTNIYGGTHVYSTTTITGSFVAEALVNSQTNSDPWAKTGLTVQNAVASAVSNGQAFIVVTPGNGVAFQQQSSTGDACVGGCVAPNVQTNGGAYSFPLFLKLTKDGSNQVSGYYSANGTGWTQRGTATTPDGIANTQYVTLLVTAHNIAGTSTSTYSFLYVRSYASAEPTVGAAQNEQSPYVASGSLVSSVFDAGGPADFGALTFSYASATNTSVQVRVRTSNNSDMSGAADFSLCDPVSSGADISSNNCVTDKSRYVQYQVSLASSDNWYSPIFQSFNLAYTPTPSYTLSYSGETNGSISGSAAQTVYSGNDGSAVTAVASSGYRFKNWSDGSAANPRTDQNITANLSVSAIFEPMPSGGIAIVALPPGIGLGERDATAIGNAIGATVNVGQIDASGVNVLTYITNKNNFSAPESGNDWDTGNHYFEITGLNLLHQEVTIAFHSVSSSVALKKGETKNVDLDGDKINDISVAFVDTFINRAEITVKSLANPGEASGGEVSDHISSKYFFKRDLKAGMSGADVKELQKYLNNSGFAISPAGAGSSGKESSYFGVATKNALAKFQKANNIKPAQGYFGAITRKIVN